MRALMILLLAAALIPATAGAASLRPWVEATGSWATYSMGDVNKYVGNINADIAPLSMDKIHNGLGFGGRIGLDLPKTLGFGVGYERLGASTDVSDAGATLTLAHPANAFSAFFEYRLPEQGRFGMLLGVSGGMVSESGKLEMEGPTRSETITLSGSGPLFQLYFGSTLWAMPQFGIGAAAGYRYARIGQVTAKEEGVSVVMRNADNSDMTTDYSGAFVRLGLKFVFGK